MNNLELKNNPNALLFVKKSAILYKIRPKDISHVEVEGRYCKICTSNNNFIVESSLVDFHKKLPEIFSQVHRKYVVNTAMIKEIHINDNLIVLEDNKTITISRRYKYEFLEHHYIVK